MKQRDRLCQTRLRFEFFDISGSKLDHASVCSTSEVYHTHDDISPSLERPRDEVTRDRIPITSLTLMKEALGLDWPEELQTNKRNFVNKLTRDLGVSPGPGHQPANSVEPGGTKSCSTRQTAFGVALQARRGRRGGCPGGGGLRPNHAHMGLRPCVAASAKHLAETLLQPQSRASPCSCVF